MIRAISTAWYGVELVALPPFDVVLVCECPFEDVDRDMVRFLPRRDLLFPLFLVTLLWEDTVQPFVSNGL